MNEEKDMQQDRERDRPATEIIDEKLPREVPPEELENPSASEYMGVSEVFTYWFRKKDPNRPSNFNIRAMHTINKISLAMFLIAIVVWLLRRLL